MEIIAGTTATTMATQSITPKGLKFDPPFSLLHSQSYAPIRTSLQYSIISRKPRITTRSIADDTTSNTVTKVAAEDPSFAVKKKAADISTELKGTSVFLVGMNNAIKTHLGNFLADALRYYYFDSDSLVFEAAGGESAAKAFRESDEKGYQQAETEVLKQLSSMGRLVVCAGNGAVQSSANLALLRHGISLWIDVPPGMVARMDHSGFPESELFALYKEMRDGYATADATVSLQKVASQLGYDDLDAVTTEDMTLEVLKEIEKLTRKKKMMEEAARPF
ncbi:putative inactive shikimate kinase like 1 [Citrus sinensis]|uniref:probable inactive shikimate kinase like 1, chloroplastic isoform X2 n=1 Tax=Citrus clementina TaxID=85681 RepID=UPI000CECFF3B|nr:probable inactive shikimate kinase like 1, chloroplastic isoform X2 [Citrus x clementina]XP_024950324.1 probable inactive shikimate kinase like 1, chloroplastic isoform X3 [Citrus sinensis]KAH9743326.1 putative inactive shikimate kinase like 1 [Citrus sinensis]